MIGIVVVSHSPELAQATVNLALQMVSGEIPAIAIAAGAGEGVIGTNAVEVAEAITRVSSPDGVLVFMDLGSAVLSAELALDFVSDPEVEVRLSGSPFVEGVIAGVVRAAGGASLAEVESEARGALGPKLVHLGEEEEDPSGPDSSSPSLDGEVITVECRLLNQGGIHARPAAMLSRALSSLAATVTLTNLTSGRGPAPANSPTAVMSMGGKCGDVLRICASGEERELAIEKAKELVVTGFGEAMNTQSEREPVLVFGGPVGVSPGRAVGSVLQFVTAVLEEPMDRARGAGEHNVEIARLEVAVQRVRAALEEKASRASGIGRDVLEATAEIANDPVLMERAVERITLEDRTAAGAIWTALTEMIDSPTQQGGVLGERAADLRDIRDRLVAYLLDRPVPGVPERSEPYVLVAKDLAPADTATLDPTVCLALVTEEGGPTSHTAIIAKSLGIPAVVSVRGATSIPNGTFLAVDGSEGSVVVDPSPEELERLYSQVRSVPPFGGEGSTRDGHRVGLLANVANTDDISAALEASAEGVGLFRTEMCFLNRTVAPTFEEQVSVYRRVLSSFPHKKVVIRTLDAGADKPLPFLNASPEPNPALGVRGFRTAWNHPELLEEQVRAIAHAAETEAAEAWIMAPMISTPEEAQLFSQACRERGIKMVGVMIETPAAVVNARDILQHVDFLSIGTNDLAQYTMAADRMIGDLAHFNDPWQPAVLRMIKLTCEAASISGKPVGVCGEAASDPMLAPVLVGLGVSALSMTPRSIAFVSSALDALTLSQCEELGGLAVDSSSSERAKASVRDAMAGMG